MDEEVRVGFQRNYFAPIRISISANDQQDNSEEEETRYSRTIEMIAHYVLVTILLVIIGFYLFFISSIIVDKYTSGISGFEYPYAKDVDRNRALYRADCFTICNLDEKQFNFLFEKKKPKHKSYKPVSIDPSNEFQFSCITTAKTNENNNIPEIIDRFQFDKLDNESQLKVLNQFSKNQDKYNNTNFIKKRDKNEKEESFKRSTISIYTHRYREETSFKKIIQHSLILDYHSNSSIILKSYNSNTFNIVLKDLNKNSLDNGNDINKEDEGEEITSNDYINTSFYQQQLESNYSWMDQLTF